MQKEGGAFRITMALLIVFGSLLAGVSYAAPATTEAQAMGTNTFTLTLYRQLLAQEKGNIFFSPVSISLALAMAYGGARGETAAEMARVLGYNLPPAQLHPALAHLSRHLAAVGNKDGQTLSVANAAWIKTGLSLLPPYLNVIRNYYSDEIRQLDFCQEGQARKTINAWVARKTENRITDLIPPRALDCDTSLVLTNAIYFLGEWAEKFATDQTKPELFWLAPDKNVEVPFMHRRGEYAYTAAAGWQVLELPYRGKNLSMVILLPETRGALPELEKSLKPEMLEKLIQDLHPRQVVVSLPRFTIEATLELKPYLKAAGMVAAFGNKADFRGITTEKTLYIDQVFHKAWVKVEEKGTEAAAATAVIMRPTAALRPEEPVVFQANHPFLFLIRDRETGLMLFWGRLSQL